MAEALAKRSFSASASASASAHDDGREAAKWEKIAYAGIARCTVLAFYNLSKEHPHYEEPPSYSYLHIRNKEFPWGPDGPFEEKHHDHQTNHFDINVFVHVFMRIPNLKVFCFFYIIWNE